MRFALAFALLALSVPALSQAEDDLPPTTQFFEEYDTNADGSVSRDEFTGSADVFRLLDKNGDGAITGPELGLPADYRPSPSRRKKAEQGTQAAPGRGGGAMGARMQRFLEKYDEDSDGKVSRQEWRGRNEGFDRLDRNGDGFIDGTDFQGRGGKQRGGAKGGTPTELPARLRAMDADENGLVSRQEWKGPAELFDRLDKNGSGSIEPAELGGQQGRQGNRQRGRSFEDLDKNGDGHLDSEDGLQERTLKRLDKDEDGRVSADEYEAARKRGAQAGMERMLKGMLRRFDEDKDGKVSRDEFPGSDERFERMDRNGDGFLSKDDLATDEAPKSDRPVTPDVDTPRAPKAGSLLERLDKNGDGKLDRSEWDGEAEAWKRLDKDGDGWVTAAELAAAGRG